MLQGIKHSFTEIYSVINPHRIKTNCRRVLRLANLAVGIFFILIGVYILRGKKVFKATQACPLEIKGEGQQPLNEKTDDNSELLSYHIHTQPSEGFSITSVSKPLVPQKPKDVKQLNEEMYNNYKSFLDEGTFHSTHFTDYVGGIVFADSYRYYNPVIFSISQSMKLILERLDMTEEQWFAV